jgi:flagellar hook-associated protein 1 FlgK
VTQALGIGASSVNADMTAIDALAQDIANAQTPGYLSEAANLAALPGGSMFGAGSGVEVTSIVQATNALLSSNNWQAQGALSNLSALQETLSAVESIFPLAGPPAGSTTGASTSSSISGQLSTFWSAWDAIAENPSSQAPRVEVLDDAQGLVTSLHEAASQLSQITHNAIGELTGQVKQVNTLLAQVASLNKSIVLTSGAGSSTAPLEDQLQSALTTLSQLAGVDVRMQPNGTATVSIGGVTVVQEGTAGTLQLTSSVTATSGPAARHISVELELGSGTGLPVPVSSGSVAGLLSAVNTYIPKAQSMLNGVAAALATTVNNELKTGYTATGALASSTADHWQMFVGTTTASGIEVNTSMVSTPSLIAVSDTNATTGRAAANNGGIAQAMAELGTTPAGPDGKYQTLVQSIGALTQSVNNQMDAQTAVAAQAQQALQSVTGVDVTTDLTSLLSYQQNYEASAKVLTTVDSAVQALLQAV